MAHGFGSSSSSITPADASAVDTAASPCHHHGSNERSDAMMAVGVKDKDI